MEGDEAMAFKPEYEAWLKGLPPETEKIMRELATKDPEMENSFLRQADYNKFMNEGKVKIETAEKKYSDIKTWETENRPKHDRLMEEHRVLTERNTQLEEDIKKAAAAANAEPGAEGHVTPAALMLQVEERVKSMGYVSQKDLSRIIVEEADKIATAKAEALREDFFKKTWPQAVAWNNGMVRAQFAYRDEFGKPLPEDDFAKFMTDHKIADPTVAYQQFTAADRENKRIEAEVTKRLEAERSKANLPGVSSSNPGSEVGPLQLRIARPDANDPLFKQTGEIGDNSAAMAAAAELRAEGKV